MTTYNFDPVPVYGEQGGLVKLGARKSQTFPVTDLSGASVTVVQGGTSKVGYIESDASGDVPSFSTTDVPSVMVTFIVGKPLRVDSREALEGVGDAVDAANAAIAALGSKVGKGDLFQNPKDSTYGAVGDGVADDTAAIQAALNVGDVFLPGGTYKITAPLTIPTGRELRGAGAKASTLTIATDTTMIQWAGGEGQALRNLRLQSTFADTHTKFLLDVANPTRPVLQYVEVSFPTASTMAGIRFRRDAGQPGTNSFMPSLDGVWLRNGRLVTDNVTDGFMANSWVWANAVGAPAAIDMSNISDGWTFSNVQVVPCDGTGAGYLFTNTNHIKIVGGYMDGSYDGVSTGHGIRAVSSGRIEVSGYTFFNLGRSAIRLESTNACSFTACGFYRGNKSDGSWPDIDLYSSTGNVFIGNSHSQPRNQTNKGTIYREDSGSTKNDFDHNVLDTSLGNYYATPIFQGNAATRGPRCKPESLWPRSAAAATVIAPPASLVSIAAPAAWPAANTAIAHRLHVPVGAVYSLGQFRVDSGSGNMQMALVQVSGNSYTKILDSGIVACTTGDKILSLGAAFIDPGEYALVLWCDNATATFRYVSNSGLTASRLTAEFVNASGVPASGTLAWGSTKYVGGISLGN